MQARCPSWNPTRPALSLSRLDAGGFVVASGLAAFALFSLVG